MLLDWGFPFIMVSVAIYGIARRDWIAKRTVERSQRMALQRAGWPWPFKGKAMSPRGAYLTLWAGITIALGLAAHSVVRMAV